MPLATSSLYEEVRSKPPGPTFRYFMPEPGAQNSVHHTQLMNDRIKGRERTDSYGQT